MKRPYPCLKKLKQPQINTDETRILLIAGVMRPAACGHAAYKPWEAASPNLVMTPCIAFKVRDFGRRGIDVRNRGRPGPDEAFRDRVLRGTIPER